MRSMRKNKDGPCDPPARIPISYFYGIIVGLGDGVGHGIVGSAGDGHGTGDTVGAGVGVGVTDGVGVAVVSGVGDIVLDGMAFVRVLAFTSDGSEVPTTIPKTNSEIKHTTKKKLLVIAHLS